MAAVVRGVPMHETSLGTEIIDFLTGKPRERTIYEDLRQSMIAWFVTGAGFGREAMQSHVPVGYTVDCETFHRRADLIIYDGPLSAFRPVSPSGSQRGPAPLVLATFCPGQVETYLREVTALARLLLPRPSPFAVVTDMKEIRLFNTASGEILARSFAEMPGAAWFHAQPLAPVKPLDERAIMAESRILHAYSGLLKDCCGENCPVDSRAGNSLGLGTEKE